MAQSTLTKIKFSAAAVPAETSGRRPDIQGLRALAVLAVVFDHLAKWPSGGFVGVDIFFVISGFLITGLLIREWEKSGVISFTGFYKRRIKRILPASILVLLATIAATFMLFTTSRALGVLWDGVWGTLFVANWRFAAVGTDYFQLDGPVSPLQHFWSLAVEEQFYFVWPWVMLLALVLVSKAKNPRVSPRVATAILILVVSAASLAWAISETSTSPTLAYFSTLSRTWELGIGALTALAAPFIARIPAWLTPLLSWSGLVGIIASLFVVDATSGFPAPGALLPVLSTGLVIAAGCGGHPHYLAPLTNRVSQYLGDISFSLYLWHFPIIVLGGALIKEPTLTTHAMTLAAVILMSVFAYHLVENPIRRSHWLGGAHRRTLKDPTSESCRRTWLAFLLVLTVGVTAIALTSNKQTPSDVATTPAASAEPLAGLQVDIARALQAPTWPKLNPSVDQLGTKQWLASHQDSGCSNVDQANPGACLTGPANAKLSAVIIGDSIAMGWAPGLRKALVGQGYSVQSLNRTQCPAAKVSVTRNGGESYPECDQHQAWAQEYAATLEPDLIILASASNTLTRLASGDEGPAAMTEYQKGLKKTVDALSKTKARIVVLSAPPRGQSLQECNTKISTPQDCESSGDDTLTGLIEAEQAAVGASGEAIDTRTWFCSTDFQCPAFVGTTPVRADTLHITAAYSERLAPVITEALSKKK
ncbi:acyltransferase family protein [Pseudarthrobacter sulfonivorans]|uniref:acyltransferase family protein n=1 Tax=Pseudarthrobacter sulfonivorans TaxID=121292 RepID=UPI002855C648|nr:acyltransferase family protein [Pseudarthrobacter sulfonivorans]MDR6414910.1 peptidoglycan/LPS O-acetylase OafA/YrhL [Pseudarthrobacter sulfonivorans]